MTAVQFEDVTPDRVAGQALSVPTDRLVINYIGQLHHIPIHWRPGLPAPECTSPEGVARVRLAYNELVQAYCALRDWTVAEQTPMAGINGLNTVQLPNIPS